MKLFEALGVKHPATAACVAYHEYISDRSVALLQRSSSDALDIGSGTCFRIGHRYLIATVAHNVEHLNLSQIEAVPRGAYYSNKLTLVAKNHLHSAEGVELDVAWIEVEPESFERSPMLGAFSLSQVATYPEEAITACFLQGYPSGRVELVQSEASARPSVASDGLLTMSIPPAARGVQHQAGVDFAIEYPPHDGSVDRQPLAAPPGISGGGIWWVPGFEDKRIWLQDEVRLLAIARKWYKPSKEVWGTRIEFWLKLVAADFGDLREEIQNALESLSAHNPGASSGRLEPRA
jgi:hypothetical protein